MTLMLEEILSLSWPAAEFKTPGAHFANHLSLSSFSISLKIKSNEREFFTKCTRGHGFSNTAGSVRSPLPLNCNNSSSKSSSSTFGGEMIVPSYFFPRLENKPCIYDVDLRKMQYRSPNL